MNDKDYNNAHMFFKIKNINHDKTVLRFDDE